MPNAELAKQQDTQNGIVAVAGAFFIWGLLPLYLKPLNHIPALQVAAWRYAMGCITVMGWMRWRGELAQVWQLLRTGRALRRLSITATLLAMNWTLYSWSVANGYVLMSSLGYFINPLMNVLLGVVVLSERLNRVQWIAVAIATTAVSLLAVQTGQVPWLALGLAITFGLYGLLRKIAGIDPLPGLAVETLLVAPLAVSYLLWVHQQPMPIADHSALVMIMLALSGVMTIVPLAMFNYGAQRINYSTVGMLQYLGPIMQFAIGIFIYHETLTTARLFCFALIWVALLVYAADGLVRSRTPRAYS